MRRTNDLPDGWEHAIGWDRDHPFGTIEFVCKNGAIIVGSHAVRYDDSNDGNCMHDKPMSRQGFRFILRTPLAGIVRRRDTRASCYTGAWSDRGIRPIPG